MPAHPWLSEFALSSRVTAATFSADGSLVLLGLADGSLELRDSLWGTQLLQVSAHARPIADVGIDAQRARVYAIDSEGRLGAWSAQSGLPIPLPNDLTGVRANHMFVADQQLHVLSNSGTWYEQRGESVRIRKEGMTRTAGYPALFGPGGAGLVLANDSNLLIVQAVGDALAIPTGGRVIDLSWSSDASTITALYEGGRFAKIDIATGNIRSRGQLPEATARAWIPIRHDKQIAILTDRNHGFKVWDSKVRRFEPLASNLFVGHTPALVAASPTTGMIVTATDNGRVRLWHHSGILPSVQQQVGDARTLANAVSSRGNLAALGDSDGKVHIVSLFDARPAIEIDAHRGKVNGIDFAASGRRLVSGGEDNLVRVWDATTGRAIYRLRGHISAVSAVDAQTNGPVAITGGLDGMVFAWDSSEGREIHRYRAHTEFVNVVAVDDSGRWLSGGQAGRVCTGSVGEGTFTILVQSGPAVTSVSWIDPDTAAVGKQDGTLSILSTSGRNAVETTQVSPSAITMIDSLGDGRLLIASEDSPPYVWSLQDKARVWTFPGSQGGWTQRAGTLSHPVFVRKDGQIWFVRGLPADEGDPTVYFSRLLATHLGAVQFSPADTDFTDSLAVTVEPVATGVDILEHFRFNLT